MPVKPVSHDPFRFSHVAAMGRGGDTLLGHFTEGDTVIPVELITPQVKLILKAILGPQLARFTAGSGSNSINPRTGLMEFDDDSGSPDSSSSGGPGTPDSPGAAGNTQGGPASSPDNPNEGKDTSTPGNNPTGVAGTKGGTPGTPGTPDVSTADIAGLLDTPEMSIPGVNIHSHTMLDDVQSALAAMNLVDISVPPAQALAALAINMGLGMLPGIGTAVSLGNLAGGQIAGQTKGTLGGQIAGAIANGDFSGGTAPSNPDDSTSGGNALFAGQTDEFGRPV